MKGQMTRGAQLGVMKEGVGQECPRSPHRARGSGDFLGPLWLAPPRLRQPPWVPLAGSATRGTAPSPSLVP